jgi:formyltetrahydrofolate synthetase
MKTDIEIARSIELVKIKQVARETGIPVEHISNYGRYIAKVDESQIDEEKVQQSNLILVTAITPTKAGIGKTTVSIGLALGLNKIGKKTIVATVSDIGKRSPMNKGSSMFRSLYQIRRKSIFQKNCNGSGNS